MGIFSKLFNSLNKSKEIKRLQNIIDPEIVDVVAKFRHLQSADQNKINSAFEEYLDLCKSDENIAQVLVRYKINRNDLKNIYETLSNHGLGGWTKGHHCALSSLAYPEPLTYILQAQKRGTSWEEIVIHLNRYWDGRISQGTLLQYIKLKPSSNDDDFWCEQLKNAAVQEDYYDKNK